MTLSYEEYKERRGELSRQAVKRKEYKTGHKVQSMNFCSMCGKSLTNLVLSNMTMTANTNFNRLTMDKLIYVNICKRGDKCYKNYLTKEGE